MKKLALVGGSSAFSGFLAAAFDGEIVKYKGMEEAGRAALSEPHEAVLLIAPPGEPLPAPSLEGLKIYSGLWNRGQKVYAELFDTQDGPLA